MHLTINARGIAGYYEDIPALILVTIGMSLFLISAFNGYIAYVNAQERAKLTADALEFVTVLQSYDGLLYEPQMRMGLYDAQKVQTFASNESYALMKLNSALRVGFDFRIRIVDMSDYPVKFDLYINSSAMLPSAALKLGRYSIESTVNIYVASTEVHAAKLIVTIWM